MSAARPTWTNAVGSAMAPTFQYSSRDLKYHEKLKLRRPEDTVLAVNFGTVGNAATDADADVDMDLVQLITKDSETTADKDQGDVPPHIETAEAAKDGKDGKDDTDDEQDEDDEDDTEALLRELEKIKKERETEREQRALEELAKAVKGNPLTRPDAKSSFLVKRRWDDDTVFKNQASSSSSNKPRSFINDTLRSDFHRKFMKRYIK